MNRTFRNAFYDFFYYSGIARNLLYAHQKQRKVILTYHNVLPKEEMGPHFTNVVDVQKDVFELQIQMLVKNFKIQPAGKITDPLYTGIFLSFDDGMLNNIEIVEPVLRKYGITAMFGICSGLVKNDIEFIWRDAIFLMLKSLLNKKLYIPDMPLISGNEINELNLNKIASSITEYIQANNKMDKVYSYLTEVLEMNNVILNRGSFSKLRYSPMNLSDVRYLQSCGHYIASHTHTHRKLSMLSDVELRNELNISKDYLMKELGNCHTLVYPYGASKEVNNRVKDFAGSSGYKYAFLNTTKGFDNSSLFIPRINMGNISAKSNFFGILAEINKLFK